MMTEANRPDATISIPDGTETPLPKSATITLTAPGATMSIVAERKPDNSAKTYVLTADENGKNTKRGISETHATFEAAKLVTERLAKAAEKLGWARKQKRQGFVSRPDAFTTIPAPPKAKK
jgi:hypothetical protein